MERRSSIPRWIARASLWASMTLIALAIAGCGDDDDEYPYGTSACRFDPAYCGGGPGGYCRTNADCFGGFCCTDDSNCGGGMCTFSCDRDVDCPSDMACEHGMCFFMCRSDADCAYGQRCEHGRTVCEWP